VSGSAVVSNTGPIIALDQIGILELLPQNFGRIVIPPAVRRELITVTPPTWIEVVDPVYPLDPRIRAASLDPGESEAIALAITIGADGILLDDLPARLLAARLGLQVIGTLGALVRAKEAHLIAAVQPYLDALRSVNFFMSERLYERLLRAVDEAG
jgi:predicted nucleic acid-binding protein